MTLFTKLFQFVMLITARHKIDDSHGISHSMNVLHFAHNIYNDEIFKNPELVSQERLIYVSAIIHDMCDKKYMNEKDGVAEIEEYLGDKLTPLEIDTTKQIVSTMSYSKVKKQGFPDLGPYMSAYHIVRESDLLSAYDFDRSMIYHMYNSGSTTEQAFSNAKELFRTRVLNHDADGLFTTGYAKRYYPYLQCKALSRMNAWERILTKKY